MSLLHRLLGFIGTQSRGYQFRRYLPQVVKQEVFEVDFYFPHYYFLCF